ncbi:hypothetical protein O6H91_01G101000 [Diphasiastrum complanatum]|uniref:Uncharacterized protein n=1 Tax=Diphasiastrum complanatum TaxID=34168 RepID=A0ACC2ETU4_DIPCM|nr:hypothetical protein O6H91_01G101000 [Diphasiastrum complanatum]
MESLIMRCTVFNVLFVLLTCLNLCFSARLNPDIIIRSRDGSQQPATPSLCAIMVQIYEYPCEEHVVTTPDGFQLPIHHIPHGISGSTGSSQATVVLQHGLAQGAENFMLNGPSESLAFILADAGFDVWVGNTRTTMWSPGNVELSPNTQSYWNWSFDQLISYDLPTMLQYVYSTTGNKIHYIGHSQGSLIALGALSQDTSLTDLFAASVLLSPVAYLNNSQSIFAKDAADLYLDKLFDLAGIQEFNPLQGIGVKLLDLVCASANFACRAFWAPSTYLNYSRVAYYMQYEPQPTSTINIRHYAQMVRSGLLQKFDYGTTGNRLQYSQENPPIYDVSKIPSQVSLLLAYGGKDALADVTDVQKLIQNLNCQVQTLFMPQYGHSDFILGTKANEDVYQPIIKYLRANSL